MCFPRQLAGLLTRHPGYLSPYPDAIDVPVGKGLKVQLLPSMEHLSMARKYHQAAFIADEGLLVVWDDSQFASLLEHPKLLC